MDYESVHQRPFCEYMLAKSHGQAEQGSCAARFVYLIFLVWGGVGCLTTLDYTRGEGFRRLISNDDVIRAGQVSWAG